MMTRPAVVTVLTARPWEARLVSAARVTGEARIVARAYEPQGIAATPADVIVAGSNTPWVTPANVRSWKNSGRHVLGLHPPGDAPGRKLFAVGGAAETRADDTDPLELLTLIRALAADRSPTLPSALTVQVTGPRGAPGRSEVALGLAWAIGSAAKTLLIDLDSHAPALGLRLGLPPQRSVTDHLRASGDLRAQATGPISILPAPVAEGPLGDVLRLELMAAARASFEIVIADVGPWSPLLPAEGDLTVLVCEPSSRGILRAAQACLEWQGRPPAIVLNRVEDEETAVRSARMATGLEPTALVARSMAIEAAVNTGGPPAEQLVEALRPLASQVMSQADG